MAANPLEPPRRPDRPRPRGRRRCGGCGAGLRHVARRCSAGWARPSMWSARKAATSACGCSWASAPRSSPPAPSIRPASPNWPSAPSRWRAWCRRTRTPAWPIPPRRRSRLPLDLDDPAEPDDRGAGRARRRGRGGGARRAGHHQFRRRRGRLRPSRGIPGHLGRVRRPSVRTSHSVSATALAGSRDGDAARLRLPFHRPPRRPGRSGGDRPQRRRAGRSPGSIRPGRRPRSCPSCTIRASPAACSAIWPARSTAPRWRAAPRS